MNDDKWKVYYFGKYPKKKKQFFNALFCNRRKAINFCKNRYYSFDGLTIVDPSGNEEKYLKREEK